MNVAGELAAAYAIVLHVALLAPVTLLGLFFLWQENLSLSDVARRSEGLAGDVASLPEAPAGKAQS